MVVAIFGILMIAIQSMFSAGVNVFDREKQEMNARSQLYVAAEQMIKIIRNTPLKNITLTGPTNGVYNEIQLTSVAGVATRFYLLNGTIYREEGGQTRVVANQIETLDFSVICDAASGVYDSYTSSNRQMADADGAFAGHDPALVGMFIRFERVAPGGSLYIYRKINSCDATSVTLDQDFSVGFTPSNRNYAIGKTIKIYLKNQAIPKKQTGSEVTTGVTPRF